MARTLLRKINQYSEEFKATAVGSSSLREVLIQDVARSLDIHPLMLSRWRKEAHEGKIVTKRVNLEPQRKGELKRLRGAALQDASGGARVLPFAPMNSIYIDKARISRE